jgi:hypothetical protein
MAQIERASIIAERKLLLDGEPSVVVRIAKPELDDESTHVCRYEIVGLAYAGPGRACGADAMQALVLALNLIAVVIETSAEARAGRLGAEDFGFRYPDDTTNRGRVSRNEAALQAPSDDRSTLETAGGATHAFDTLGEWSELSDEDLRALFSADVEETLRRVIDELIGGDVFPAIGREAFPQIVRMLRAVEKEGSVMLGRAIVEADDHRKAGRDDAFKEVMQRFMARSPTRFHRDVAGHYLAGTRREGP